MCARLTTQIVQTPNGRRELYGMEDKAVSTSDDLIAVLNISNGDDGGDEITTWNASTVDKLLATLIRTKLMSIQERPPTTDTSDSEKSSYSWPNDAKDKEPPDKKYGSDRRRQQQRQASSSSRPHHHYHHHHHHRCPKQVQLEEQQQRTSISKVQKWSDDLDMETSFERQFSEDETAAPFQERVDERTKLTTNKTYASTAPRRKGDANTKRTSGKRKKRRRKSQRRKKGSQIDAEDLPKRARWTIVITSGLLILTCMLLVGITLRMAPVIDQMVRTKNEELMNSLNRENAPVRYYSTDT